MDLKDLCPENLLPHRDSMLLIDKILEVGDGTTVSKSVVSDQWPLFKDSSASPIIMIELTAQTAGINNSLHRLQKRGKQDGNMGWIAGVKTAVFHLDALPLGAALITRTRNSFSYEDFREVIGTVTFGKRIAGEITLQLVSA